MAVCSMRRAMTLKQWREFRTVIIRALLMIVRHLQKQEQAEKQS